MPVAHELLRGNPVPHGHLSGVALVRCCMRSGQHVASNAEGLIGGRIIISDNDQGGGTFVITTPR
jgi:hypothetical protein